MESVGAISEGELFSFNGMCSEEADFMAQLLGNCSIPHEVPNSSSIALSSTFWPVHESNMCIAGGEESTMYESEETNTNPYSFSQGSSYGGGSSVFFPSSSHDSFYHQIFMTNNNVMDHSMMESKNHGSRIRILANNVIEGDDFLNQDVSNDSLESNENLPEDFLQLKNFQHETPMSETLKEEDKSEISKKRPRFPGEVPRGKRGMKLKKCQKSDDTNEDNNNNDNNGAVLHRQRSNSYCSEDDSNVSNELNGVTSSSCSKGAALNMSGKTRAGRGSATDPQSLYARKRRERINERLRILQNLVPNGTKVDISTMLEEAVQYVKFLQLQIKLLSSDDLWMYAPLAYNGMDIGLDLKISLPKSQSS